MDVSAREARSLVNGQPVPGRNPGDELRANPLIPSTLRVWDACRMGSRVLIVEKEPVVRELLAELLEEGDREVLRAANAAEALQSARARAPIDVALAEKELPDHSGLDLARQLKALDSTTEVILMSTSPSLHAVLEAVEAGASDFLPKPFEDITQVAIRVASAEEQATLRRESERLHLALVESEERYRKLFEATPDAVVVFDEGTGLIADANAEALALYGFLKGEFVGLPIAKLRSRGGETRTAPRRSRSSIPPPGFGGVLQRCDITRDGTQIDVELVSGRFHAHGRNMGVEIIHRRNPQRL